MISKLNYDFQQIQNRVDCQSSVVNIITLVLKLKLIKIYISKIKKI